MLRVAVVGESPWLKGGNLSALLSENPDFDIKQISFTQSNSASLRSKLHARRRSKRYGRSSVQKISSGDTDALSAALDEDFDAILLYGDHGHASLNTFLPLSSSYDGPPLVLGLHNHHCSTGQNPTSLLDSASGLILLSSKSYDFYKGYTRDPDEIPKMFMPSLYLPRKSTYPSPQKLTAQRLIRLQQRDSIVVALGGNWFTADPSLPRSEQSERYNFLALMHMLASGGSQIHLYGTPKEGSVHAKAFLDKGLPPPPNLPSETIGQMYRDLTQSFPGVHLKGLTREYEKRISQVSFIGLKGFVSADHVTYPFEQMNYQLRYSSSLLAGVPALVARGTDSLVEGQLELHGWGYLWSDETELEAYSLREQQRQIMVSGDLQSAQEVNSMDHYNEPLLDLLYHVTS